MKKYANAQGIRHRHINSPVLHHDITVAQAGRPSLDGRLDTNRLTRRSSDAAIQ